ncbi:RNA polymerase sigma factor [Rivihabitans pingtungensis]|uniref:RNA polymerase sigma-70 factor (ECF subfamily) n=2 Tax=Rivihabitans pingtungensis TaxID=1054498 RepID=A0A318KE27_9NEIS|nr:sigma-70 family RNA polymerase sigma factor [Rivihabitans pingtungensis]PXX74486.1 RNA polymerase sigma-70 factor (ECF subfamily) [Rivihabitans pingtungensis]
MEQEMEMAISEIPMELAIGGRSRFENAWRSVRADLGRRARRLTHGDHDRAEELLSRTALKAFLYICQFSERVRDAEGFLFLVLNHTFLDSARRNTREEKVIDPYVDLDTDSIHAMASSAPSPLQALLMQEELEQVRQALMQLSDAQRMLFQLKFEEERPYSEIAAAFGISEALARKRVELLRKKLHALLPQRRVH